MILYGENINNYYINAVEDLITFIYFNNNN